MTIKEEVQKVIDNVLVYAIDSDDTPYLDPNANYRRWFRCWIDGSWIGRDRVIESETVETTNRRELREIVFHDVQFIPRCTAIASDPMKASTSPRVKSLQMMRVEGTYQTDHPIGWNASVG